MSGIYESIIWDTPSRNAGESMPVGGYDIGINVWFENGEILLYFGRSDSFDENNTLLKSGRIRVHFFHERIQFVRQIFRVQQGDVQVELKVDDSPLRVEVWCSQNQSCFSLHLETEKEILYGISYENWRYERKKIPDDGHRWQCCGLSRTSMEVIQYPDDMEPFKNGVYFYHKNTDDLIIDKILYQQGLEKYKEKANDCLTNAIFGGMMIGKNLEWIKNESFFYKGHEERRSMFYGKGRSIIHVFLAHQQNKSAEWMKKELIQRYETYEIKEDREKTKIWWRKRWSDTYIDMHSEDGKADEIGRNYQIFRYQLLCNTYGKFPTKFNGGLFTVDPYLYFQDEQGRENPNDAALSNSAVKGKSLEKYDADWRLWGGGTFVAQNQRLVYWPMLMNGDYDAMRSQFDLYKNSLELASAMVSCYWGHRGAAFGEHLENIGCISGFAYGWRDETTGRRPNGETDLTEYAVPYIKYYYTTALEFCYMILKYRQYSGRSIEEYVPLIHACILFFYDHYRMKYKQMTLQELDEEGHLVISPSTACETYKNAVNPTDAVAALRSVIPLFLDLCSKQLSQEVKMELKEILNTVPELSYVIRNGKKCIAPAKTYTGIINVELPQLYPVFPYGMYGVGKEDLETAVNTWREGVDLEAQRNIISWHQDNIFVACMGLRKEAEQLNYAKMKNASNRFPTFYGPGHDWIPDHNWGGSGMIGIQKMLVQETKDRIYLLPAWPKNWKVNARVHLENQAIIEFQYDEVKLKIVNYYSHVKKKIINGITDA